MNVSARMTKVTRTMRAAGSAESPRMVLMLAEAAKMRPSMQLMTR